MSTNLADNIAPQIQIWDQIAIGVCHEMNGFSADHFGCGILFLMANRAEFFRSHVGLCRGIKSLIAACEQDIRDVMSGAGPFSERRTAEEFWVVGMGEDDEDVLRGVPSFRFHESGSSVE